MRKVRLSVHCMQILCSAALTPMPPCGGGPVSTRKPGDSVMLLCSECPSALMPLYSHAPDRNEASLMKRTQSVVDPMCFGCRHCCRAKGSGVLTFSTQGGLQGQHGPF